MFWSAGLGLCYKCKLLLHEVFIIHDSHNVFKEYLLSQLSNGGEQKGGISGLQMSELGQKAVELLPLNEFSERRQS